MIDESSGDVDDPLTSAAWSHASYPVRANRMGVRENPGGQKTHRNISVEHRPTLDPNGLFGVGRSQTYHLHLEGLERFCRRGSVLAAAWGEWRQWACQWASRGPLARSTPAPFHLRWEPHLAEMEVGGNAVSLAGFDHTPSHLGCIVGAGVVTRTTPEPAGRRRRSRGMACWKAGGPSPSLPIISTRGIRTGVGWRTVQLAGSSPIGARAAGSTKRQLSFRGGLRSTNRRCR